MNRQVYINGRFLTRKITGVERFSIEICKEFVKLYPNVKIIAPKEAKAQAVINDANVIYVGKYSGYFWEQITLPVFLKKRANPVLLNLANLAPIFYSNNIITLHDIAFKRYPEWYNPLFSRCYNKLIPSLLKRAKHIITVSEFSKKEIIDVYKIEEDKISVIYNGLPQSFLMNQSENKGYDFKYILTVGSFQPRKNLVKLLEAYQQVPPPKSKLVIVGSSNKVFRKIRTQLNLNEDNIILKENVNDKELSSLYRHAEKFIFPSLYEGFGLPILEALHYDCPVFASDIPVFKELFGDTIQYFNPNNIPGIKKGLISNSYPKRIRELKNQIKKYNFEVSARKLNRIIETV